MSRMSLDTPAERSPVQWENSAQRYGVIAQTLHATMALLFIGAFATVYGRRWFTVPETAQNLAILQIHFSIGWTVLLLAGLRLWWRQRSATRPAELPGAPIEHAAARIVHVLLYTLMFLMPLTGYLGTGLDTRLFGIITIPRFADTAVFDVIVARGLGLGFEQFEGPVAWLHKTLGETALLILVGVHVGAAVFHHSVRRDGALGRMFPAFHSRNGAD